MFTDSTVLILGAGASSPYGFPLGMELKNRIMALCFDTHTHQSKQMLHIGHTEEHIKAFHKALIGSVNETIDTFLEDRPDFQDIGAFAIAQVLMALENEDTLFPPKDWYPCLFRDLDPKRPDRTPPVAGIITLNYDRSLEHYLVETAHRTYQGATRDAALRKLRSFPIVHVHGALGPYPELPYTPNHSLDEIARGAKGIKLVHDAALDQATEFHQARSLLSMASEIIFLGFGYEPRTMKRLSALVHSEHCLVFGTALNLHKDRESELKNRIKPGIELSRSSIIDFLKDLDDTRAALVKRRTGRTT